MCNHVTVFRPIRELEEKIIEECNLSDLSITDIELDAVSALLVMTLENPMPGDIRRLELDGWCIEGVV